MAARRALRAQMAALAALMVLPACLGEVSRNPVDEIESPLPEQPTKTDPTAAEEGVTEPTPPPAVSGAEVSGAQAASVVELATDDVIFTGSNCAADVNFAWQDERTLRVSFDDFKVHTASQRARVNCNLAAQLRWTGERVLITESPVVTGHAELDREASATLSGDLFNVRGEGQMIPLSRGLANAAFEEAPEGVSLRSRCGESETLRANLSLSARGGVATAELSTLTVVFRLTDCD